MKPSEYLITFILCLMLSQLTAVQSQERDRTKIPDKYKWNLTDLFATTDAWQKAKSDLIKGISGVAAFKGSLSSSPQKLLGCLKLVSDLSKEFARISVYAGLLSDQDTRNSQALAMQQEMGQVGANFGAQTAFIEPEILRMDRATVDQYITQEKGLEVYRHYLDDILRRQAHTGTEGEEKIIADASLMADGPQNIHSLFSNADFPYPTVTLSDGKNVKLDQAAFSVSRMLPNRGDRKQVFASFFGSLDEFRRSFGAQLYAEVNKDLFYMKARRYATCVQSALDQNNIPVAVYTGLIQNVHASLATFHRYLALRKRILGLDTLHYYDLYAPLVKGVDLNYTVEQSEKNVLDALAPLGPEYIATAKRAFSERWIDYYPNEGKQSGAYSNGGAYDVHPYMLLNYNGKYTDMSTLAHELGHTMHSYYSNKTQPYPISQYPLFVAEVASTFNEALLIDHMLKTIRDDRTRLSLLGDYLEGIKATVFRQTQFADFELKIHTMAEEGETLTGDVLDSLYLAVTREYYGHDSGVCIVDDNIKSEWAFIPHFYLNFYVFQYATSFTASAALSEKVMGGDKEATKEYLHFISSGGSDYPIELLKKAGVDLTTSAPFDLTMKKMNRVMDEIEEILNRVKPGEK